MPLPAPARAIDIVLYHLIPLPHLYVTDSIFFNIYGSL
jgi:hypothetical protein